jgi:hypothetical protein
MYVLIVATLMFVFPVTSILIESVLRAHGHLEAVVVGKWFVFWAVGVRLFLAGLRQIIQPRYTAESILGIKDAGATLVVRELGFANTAIGSIGMASILFPAWVVPTGIVGTIFYGLAGINHVTHKQRNNLENVAMTSDLFVAAVLLVFCLTVATQRLA